MILFQLSLFPALPCIEYVEILPTDCMFKTAHKQNSRGGLDSYNFETCLYGSGIYLKNLYLADCFEIVVSTAYQKDSPASLLPICFAVDTQ